MGIRVSTFNKELLQDDFLNNKIEKSKDTKIYITPFDLVEIIKKDISPIGIISCIVLCEFNSNFKNSVFEKVEISNLNKIINEFTVPSIYREHSFLENFFNYQSNKSFDFSESDISFYKLKLNGRNFDFYSKLIDLLRGDKI